MLQCYTKNILLRFDTDVVTTKYLMNIFYVIQIFDYQFFIN